MRGYDTSEAARRSRIIEEADQRAANLTEDAAKLRDTLLARIFGTDSAEDQLQYGDGYRPSADDEDDEDDE